MCFEFYSTMIQARPVLERFSTKVHTQERTDAGS